MKTREAIRKIDQLIDIFQDDIEECKKYKDQVGFDLYMEALEEIKKAKLLSAHAQKLMAEMVKLNEKEK